MRTLEEEVINAYSHLISAILSREDIHVSNIKGYLLPKTVDERTLVISTSISGNTKETLAILDYKEKSSSLKSIILLLVGLGH